MNFPIGSVPIQRPTQPLQPPPFVDPAGIIMQAAALKQQRELSEQALNQRAVQSMVEGLQSAQHLQQQKQQAQMENAIQQQGVDIARGRLPLEEAQTRLMNLQADMLSKGIGAPFYSSDQAARMIVGPDGSADQIKTTSDSLNKAFPGGYIPKDYAHQMALSAHFNIGQQTKTSEFTEKQWNNLANQNPLSKGSRSPIGLAAINNSKLSNIFAILSNPNVSDQMLSQSVLDLSTIMKGGSADEATVASQMYPTIQSKWNKFMTNITSTPQLARQPNVQLQLLQVAGDLRGVNQSYLDSYFGSLRSANRTLLTSDPGRYMGWENSIRQSLNSATPQPTLQQTSTIGGGMNTLMNAAGLGSPAQSIRSPGMITIRDSQGGMHLLPQNNLDAARQRDPGLQVMSQ